MAAHISAWLTTARASSGSPVWGVVAALAAFVVVVLMILAVVGRRAPHLIVRRQWRGSRTARDERIKRAAAADVEALQEGAKLVNPGGPRASEDEL